MINVHNKRTTTVYDDDYGRQLATVDVHNVRVTLGYDAWGKPETRTTRILGNLATATTEYDGFRRSSDSHPDDLDRWNRRNREPSCH